MTVRHVRLIRADDGLQPNDDWVKFIGTANATFTLDTYTVANRFFTVTNASNVSLTVSGNINGESFIVLLPEDSVDLAFEATGYRIV